MTVFKRKLRNKDVDGNPIHGDSAVVMVAEDLWGKYPDMRKRRPKAGASGKVIAIRDLDDSPLMLLVKFKGCGGVWAVAPEDVRVTA